MNVFVGGDESEREQWIVQQLLVWQMSRSRGAIALIIANESIESKLNAVLEQYNRRGVSGFGVYYSGQRDRIILSPFFTPSDALRGYELSFFATSNLTKLNPDFMICVEIALRHESGMNCVALPTLDWATKYVLTNGRIDRG